MWKKHKFLVGRFNFRSSSWLAFFSDVQFAAYLLNWLIFFAGLCDGFIPSLDLNSLTREQLITFLAHATSEFRGISEKFSSQSLLDNLQFLKSGNQATRIDAAQFPFVKANKPFDDLGAIEMNTHIQLAEAINSLLTSTEKMKLHFMLSILSTSVGCLILFGYPLPFQV
jgi:hypothetical protein